MNNDVTLGAAVMLSADPILKYLDFIENSHGNTKAYLEERHNLQVACMSALVRLNLFGMVLLAGERVIVERNGSEVELEGIQFIKPRDTFKRVVEKPVN